jgi:hypothetical protein
MFMKSIILGILLLSGLVVYHMDASEVNLKPGPYQPGFRLIEKYDYSRYYPAKSEDEPAVRRMRIYIWYPAQKASRTTMKLEEYIDLAIQDFHSPQPKAKELGSKITTRTTYQGFQPG